MKICLVTHTMPRYNGDPSAPFIAELLDALTNLGHQVVVVAPFDAKIDLLKPRKYRLVTYKYIFPDSWHLLGYSRTMVGDKKLSMPAYFLSPLLFIFGFLKLLYVLRTQRIDVITAHWIIPNGFIAAIASKLTGIPLTITIPGSDVYLGSRNFILRFMIRLAAKLSQSVISDSQHYLEQLHALGVQPEREFVIRYGVDTQKFNIAPKDQLVLRGLGLNSSSSIILAVGRLVPKKGFHYLIQAMPEILRQKPDAKLVIIGDGDQKNVLQEQTKKLGLNSSVIFAGSIRYTDLSKYYNICDVFVMPSVRDESGNIDASPVAMMEAMLCGKPVVATKFAGSNDIVIDNTTGFLVKEGNSSEIANAVTRLMNYKQKKEMSKSVRKIAADEFSSKATAQKYLNIFRQITS